MAMRENYRHLKNFCGGKCEISNILLQKNSATFFDIQGKQNVITITPVGENFTGDLELFTAFYHLESVILCGRLDDSTRCYRINKALDPDSLERFEGLEPLIFPFSDFVIKSDYGKVLLLEKDIYGFNMFLAENNSILWKNSFSVGDQVLATYESARNHASYIISSDKNEGMITNYCQNDAGINKTPPEANLMCSSCVSYKLSCCSKHSGLCSSEILATTKHEDAIYSVFKFGKNSRLCKTTLEKIDEEFLSQNQRYCYSTSCDTMSPSPREMGKTIKIAESICEDSDIVFADCSAPQVRLFSREYMTLVNSGLKTDKTLFMEEVGALVGNPSSFVISTDDAGARIISLLENNAVRRGYLQSDGLTMVDDKSFDGNIVLLEEVASGLAFTVEEQELISLEECHLPKETSCLKCQEGIGCQWSDSECRTVSSVVENQICPALGLLDFLESKNFYKVRILKNEVGNLSTLTCKNSKMQTSFEIEEMPEYFEINMDKISVNTLIQYYEDQDFDLTCSGETISGASWSHTFDTKEFKEYVQMKNDKEKTIEMQKNLISSLTRQKEELLELNQKGAKIIEGNQLKIAQLEKQNRSDDSENIFNEVNYLENLSRDPEISALRKQLERAYNESDSLRLELESNRMSFDADLLEPPKLAGLSLSGHPYLVATIVLGVIVFVLLIVLAVIRCGRQKIKKVATIPQHHQKAGANMWVGNQKNDINEVDALDSAISDNVFRF